MKKIIPFKKEILFNSNLSEIISISLDHSLVIEESNLIKGEFIVSGEYKMLETSVNTEPFSYTLPFTVDLDDRYLVDKAIIDIDDFYYEIINNSILKINIDVLIDNIDELEQPVLEEKNWEREELPIEEQRCIEEEKPPIKRDYEILEHIDKTENYKSYTIYIVRENDTLEQIMQKYNIAKEMLEKYNDLSSIKIGDKIIIPDYD